MVLAHHSLSTDRRCPAHRKGQIWDVLPRHGASREAFCAMAMRASHGPLRCSVPLVGPPAAGPGQSMQCHAAGARTYSCLVSFGRAHASHHFFFLKPMHPTTGGTYPCVAPLKAEIARSRCTIIIQPGRMGSGRPAAAHHGLVPW